MVMCFVPLCRHYTEQGKCKFFRFPCNSVDRQKWISLIRKKTEPTPNSRVCSCHFENGERKKFPTIFDHEKRKFAFPTPDKHKKIEKSSTTPQKNIAKGSGRAFIMTAFEAAHLETHAGSGSLAHEAPITMMPIAGLGGDDISRVCRSCLRKDPVFNIFELMYEKDSFVDILFNLFGTQVNLNDQLPTTICGKCVEEIINFYEFKKIYEKSEATLLSVITSNSIEAVEKLEDEENAEQIEPIETLDDFEEVKTELENTEISTDESYIKVEYNENISLSEREPDQIEINQTEISDKIKENEVVSKENNICNKKFYRSTFFLHRRKLHKKRYSCETCSESFMQLATLKVHKRIHALLEDNDEETSKPLLNQTNLHVSNGIHQGQKRRKPEPQLISNFRIHSS